jgi:hypothetical protein
LGEYIEEKLLAENKPTKQEIEDFLEDFRTRCRPRVEIEPRPEYFQFLLSRNLIENDANKVILEELNYSHYVSGPEEDYSSTQYPGLIWKFKIEKFETTVYIKLKLYTGKFGEPSAKCLSFHNDKNKF